eukprot:CAMPEP_0197722138 /NCGR_PEP_ID=MMETSP1434-20131217/4934_1 /TAXON_ID=265543 /ORGANISM="Minutocellus polymorphus, Strain CCMP3303" /LENGTH=607 /DNA_ID=CAMNT_0043307245 /DNA_START=109 /DNA_END=1932 /DNA_ORIENTATION=-
MCITQSRRRRSYGLNLAAYTAAYAKEAPERTAGTNTTNGAAAAATYMYTTAAPATRPTTQQEQLVDPKDGTAFTAVAFPDTDADVDANFDVLDVDIPPFASGVVSDGSQPPSTCTTGGTNLGETTTSSASTPPSSRGDAFRPLEGQYVQGVYIPPSKPAPKRTRKPQKAGLTAKRNVRHFIQHNYHDHSEEVPTEPEPTSEQIEEAIRLHNMTGGKHKPTSTSSSSSSANGGASIKISFPRKLHHILDQIERDGHAHVISWLPHGRAFAIHKPKEFIATVMPHYFQQTKITSFQRQLNLYGFQRLTRGRDNGGYYHERFLRGMAFLTKNITRTRVKGTRFKGASNPEAEPNFYGMRPVGLVVQAPPAAPAPAPAVQPIAAQQQMQMQMQTQMQQPVGLARRISEGSATSSLSCPSTNTNNQQGGYGALQRVNPIGGQYPPQEEVPRQVVVPVHLEYHHRHNLQYQQYQQMSSASIAAAASATYGQYQPSLSGAPSPIAAAAPQQQQQQQQPKKKPSSICDLWEDSPDAFEPNPYVPSPPSSPTRLVALPTTTTTTTTTGAGATTIGVDPLLDLVESWARDDTMDGLVDQAIENDLDFGHLLDIIAQE